MSIALRGVTPEQAAPTGHSLLEPERQAPAAERDICPDRPRSPTPMDIVTRVTRASVPGSRMYKMEIALAIAELRLGGSLAGNERLVMATEAELIGLVAARPVETPRKALLQYPRVAGTMRFVTGDTILTMHRRALAISLLDLGRDVLMAWKTTLLARRKQESRCV